jgi:hypothetical protein
VHVQVVMYTISHVFHQTFRALVRSNSITAPSQAHPPHPRHPDTATPYHRVWVYSSSGSLTPSWIPPERNWPPSTRMAVPLM